MACKSGRLIHRGGIRRESASKQCDICKSTTPTLVQGTRHCESTGLGEDGLRDSETWTLNSDLIKTRNTRQNRMIHSNTAGAKERKKQSVGAKRKANGETHRGKKDLKKERKNDRKQEKERDKKY